MIENTSLSELLSILDAVCGGDYLIKQELSELQHFSHDINEVESTVYLNLPGTEQLEQDLAACLTSLHVLIQGQVSELRSEFEICRAKLIEFSSTNVKKSSFDSSKVRVDNEVLFKLQYGDGNKSRSASLPSFHLSKLLNVMGDDKDENHFFDLPSNHSKQFLLHQMKTLHKDILDVESCRIHVFQLVDNILNTHWSLMEASCGKLRRKLSTHQFSSSSFDAMMGRLSSDEEDEEDYLNSPSKVESSSISISSFDDDEGNPDPFSTHMTQLFSTLFQHPLFTSSLPKQLLLDISLRFSNI